MKRLILSLLVLFAAPGIIKAKMSASFEFDETSGINIQDETINKPLKLERYGPLDELINNYIFLKEKININNIKNIIKYFYTPEIFI